MSGAISALVLPGNRLGLTFPAGVYNRAGTAVLLSWRVYWVLPCYPSGNDIAPKWLLVGQGWCRGLIPLLIIIITAVSVMGFGSGNITWK